jgi:hypothetical protein
MTDFLRRFYLFLILRRFYFLPWFGVLMFIIYLFGNITDVYFVFLLFFLVGAFSFETRNVFAVLYLRRFLRGLGVG